jgi:hypothetical protein
MIAANSRYADFGSGTANHTHQITTGRNNTIWIVCENELVSLSAITVTT